MPTAEELLALAEETKGPFCGHPMELVDQMGAVLDKTASALRSIASDLPTMLAEERAAGREDAIKDLDGLADAEETLALSLPLAFPDPAYHETVKALGRRIGFGALMSTAEAAWREILSERGERPGGEFVCGPCRSMYDDALTKIRAVLSRPSPSHDGGEG